MVTITAPTALRSFCLALLTVVSFGAVSARAQELGVAGLRLDSEFGGLALNSTPSAARGGPSGGTTVSLMSPARVRSAAGPRFGVSVLSGGAADRAAARGFNPVMTQIGWQFETTFLNNGDITGLVEYIGLVGALEQQAITLTGAVLCGLRIRQGLDVAVGISASAGWAFGRSDEEVEAADKVNIGDVLGLVIAVGFTFDIGEFGLPLHVAVVPRDDGARITALAGFTW